MRSERLPLSSLSLRALRIYFVLALIFLHGCTHLHPTVTPPPNPFEFENDVDGSKEICVQRAWGSDDDLAHWDCLSLKELRAIVGHRLRTDN